MINADVLSILNEQTNNFISKVQGNLASTGTDATKETSKSLRYEITEEGSKIILTVFGRPYFATVETGRKPTPDKKPSRNMIENISKWVAVRGKPESMVWAIAVSINKKGTDLWRKGGRTDIYTDEKENFADTIFKEITTSIADDIFKKATVSFT